MRILSAALTSLLFASPALAQDEECSPVISPQPIPWPSECGQLPPVRSFYDDQLDQRGAETNPTGEPLGGGYGYSDIKWPGRLPACPTIGRDLKTGVSGCISDGPVNLHMTLVLTAKAGDLVYLDPAGVFDFNYLAEAKDAGVNPLLLVPDGVTIASSRGRTMPGENDGALVQVSSNPVTQKWNGTLFKLGHGARITGVRIDGPKTGSGRPFGVSIWGVSGARVDNCELTGWTGAGVLVGETGDALVSHSYLHHNLEGMGYGVVFSRGGQGRVLGNIFDWNRHAIAGTGASGASYEAAWNIVGPHGDAWEQAFDMHGWIDRCESGSDCLPDRFADSDGGEWIFIHHNTFMSNDGDAVNLRGVVERCAWIDHNDFVHGELLGDIGVQAVDVDSKHRRKYGLVNGQSLPTCPVAFHSRAEMHVDVRDNDYEYSGIMYSSGGRTGWTSWWDQALGLPNLQFGDFDGDERADAFLLGDSQWKVLYSTDLRAGFQDVRTPASWSRVHVADFSGDGRADVFWADGAGWHYLSPPLAWTHMGLGTRPGGTSIAFGDFDANGKTDVFHVKNGQWHYAPGGVGFPGVGIASSNISLSSLRFGNFVGDARTDVFRTTSGQWYVSDGGAGAWQHVGSSSQSLSRLRFADLDGDGRTDIFSVFGDEWRVSWSAASAWTTIGSSSHAIESFAFADIEGDGKADVIYSGDP